jgi:dihydroorotase
MAGVTPHHLLLDLARPGLTAFGKVNPPLRAPARRDGLWNAFARGEATVVESDHAPHTVAEKSAAFAEAPAGVPGVQTLLPLLLRQAELRGVDVARVIRAACEAPADLFGLSKGRIEPGFDADLVVFDPRHPVRLRGDRLASRCGWTPFEGWESYAVESHRIRGEPVVEDGAFVGRAGHGRRVRPGAPRPAALPAAEGGA